MGDVFKPLLIAFQNKILTDIPDNEDKTGIREVNQDFGQIDIEGQRPAVAMPWVGIDFNETTYSPMQFNQQRAKGRVIFRLAFDPFSSSSSLAPETVREKAFAYYDIELKFYKAMQNFRYEYEPGKFLLITGLRRAKVTSEARRDTLRVRRMEYDFEYIDNSINEA